MRRGLVIVLSVAALMAAPAEAQVRLGQNASCVLQGTPRAATCGPGFGLFGGSAVAVSPDGASVYAGAADANAVATLSRDAESGLLRWTSCISDDGSDGTFGGDGRCLDGDVLRGPADIDLSPDGRFVYATDPRASAIAVLARDPGTGRLTPASCIAHAPRYTRCGTAVAMRAPRALALSGDGRFAYVASSSSNSVAVFARDPANGALAQTGCVSDNGSEGVCVDGVALRGATALVMSPDGGQLYVASRSSGSIGVFARDPVTGGLRQAACLLRNAPTGACARTDTLAGASALAISRDGGTLWASGSRSVTAFARDPSVGGLAGVACLGGLGCAPTTRFSRATSLLAAADGSRVLLADSSTGTVVSVARGPAGLSEQTCLRGRESFGPGMCTTTDGLDAPGALAAIPGGTRVYVAAERGVVMLTVEGPW